jgi:hypothetical protein
MAGAMVAVPFTPKYDAGKKGGKPQAQSAVTFDPIYVEFDEFHD